MQLVDYLRVLRKRWFLIVIAVLASGSIAALVTSHQEPVYQTSVKFFISGDNQRPVDASSALTNGYLAQQRILSYIELATSEPVLRRAIAQAGTRTDAGPSVTAKAVPDTVVMVVTVTDHSPTGAQSVAQAYATVLPKVIDEIETPRRGGNPLTKVTVLEAASLPTAPISPDVQRNLAVGLMLGLIFGVACAYVAEALDTSLKTVQEVGQTAGLPLLGIVPVEYRGEPLVAYTKPRSSRAEAFRQIRTNVAFASVDQTLSSLVVTSAVPAEGKTTLAINLGVTFARNGQRVVIVDADLRRPSLAEYLGLESAVGLTSVLIGDVPLEHALQSWGDGLLTVLPSGALPPNPSELLGSGHMQALIKELEARFDLVIFDTPPVLPVTDAAVLANVAGGVVLVTRVGKTTRDRLHRAREALDKVGARSLGVVANWVPGGEGKAYDYRYGYRGADSGSLSNPGSIESLWPVRRGHGKGPSDSPEASDTYNGQRREGSQTPSPH